MSATGSEGSGFSLDEAIAYDRRTGGAAPDFIESMASGIAEAFHTHGGGYADAIYAHCVAALRLSEVDQAWILYRFGQIMMRPH